MTQVAPVTFLLDVDDTLLDGDRLVADWTRHVTESLGAERAEQYWAIFEGLRIELGYVDYLAAMQHYRRHNPHDQDCLQTAAFLLDYPFASLLFPGAAELIARLNSWGPTVIVSDGDAVFQPRKIERSGLSRAVDDRMLIYVHKEQALDDVEKRYPARHYVMIDDKLRILTAMKEIWGARLTTVFTRQGHYARDPEVLRTCPPADVNVDHVGELLQVERSALVVANCGASSRQLMPA